MTSSIILFTTTNSKRNRCSDNLHIRFRPSEVLMILETAHCIFFYFFFFPQVEVAQTTDYITFVYIIYHPWKCYLQSLDNFSLLEWEIKQNQRNEKIFFFVIWMEFLNIFFFSFWFLQGFFFHKRPICNIILCQAFCVTAEL